MHLRKNEKLYRTRDSCSHTNVRVHCTNVLICHCKMDLEIRTRQKKKRSVVMWLFYFFESYILWESFCHPSYSKTVLNSCCGCEWQLNVTCVEEKTGRNSCSKSGLPCAQGQPYRTASSNNSNLRCFSVNIHPNISERNKFDYLDLWHPMEKSKAYCAVIVQRQIYHRNPLPLCLPS